MLGRKRLYFVLPNIPSARGMLNELLLARIEVRHIHFWAQEGRLPSDIPEVTGLHKTDVTHGAEIGMLAGGMLGLILGMWLVYFPPDWIHLDAITLVVTTFGGALLGSWMSGMAAAALPNSSMTGFLDVIASGKILLLVDVPFKREHEIEELIAKHHPEAKFGGVEAHIPLFP